MRKSHVLVIMIALLFVGTNAWAQGFGIYEHSSCAMGRGGAGVAAPCNDGSAIFFNPAGLALLDTSVVSLGATAINPVGGFTNSTTGVLTNLNNKYYPVPSGYFGTRYKNLSFGLGMFAPYGLTTDWPNTFEGRFLGYKTSVQGVYVQPTLAYKVNDRLSIGGGVDISRVYLELNQRVDLSSQALSPTMTFAALGVPAGTDFANATLSGTHYQAGFHFGVIGKLDDRVSLGVRYMSRQKVNLSDGDFRAYQISVPYRTPIALSASVPAGTPLDMVVRSQFLGTGSLATQKANTSITLPDQLVVGAAFKVGPNAKTQMFFDYQLTYWSVFDKLVINRANSTTAIVTPENYKNSHGFRVGVEHELNPMITLRGGFIAHTAAAPDETVTPLLPEGPRKEVAMGVGLKATKALRVDFAYQYLHQTDRAGRTVLGANNGTYTFMSHLFSTSLVLGF